MRRQHGQALLILLLIIVLIGTQVFLASANHGPIARDSQTSTALAQAREALISYALLFRETHPVNATPLGSTAADDLTLPPGTLPCPEVGFSLGNEGAQSGNCGSRDVASIGRLPWRTLGIAPPRDAGGECLWYAVSGSFKANTEPHLLNWDSQGDFEIRDERGTIVASNVVAVVFSPGAAMPGQDRTPIAGTEQCGGNYAAPAYLDSVAIGAADYANSAINPAAGKTTFIAGPVRDASGNVLANDRLAYITRDDLFARAIEKRKDFPGGHLYDASDANGLDSSKYALAQKLAACIAEYGKRNAATADKRLPWAAPLDVAAFDNDSFDDVEGQYAGRPPYRVGTSRGATGNLLVPAGCSTYNCRLLTVDHCPAGWWRVAGKPLKGDGSSRNDSPEGWWDRWKDHFFYVVAPEFSPGNSSHDWSANPDPCLMPNNKCIKVGNSPSRYAAVVIFAGQVQPGQQRAGLVDRQSIANYLEAGAAPAVAAPTTAQARTLGTGGNDQVVCIRPDLTLDTNCL